MVFKGGLEKLKLFLPRLKKVSQKRFLIFAVPAVITFAFLSYEWFIYAKTFKIVGDGDDYFKIDKLTEALAKYQEAASVWPRSLLLHRVKSSPADWRIAKTEKSIADLPKALTPEIEIVSWEANNVDCWNLSCRKISYLPQIVSPVYAACGHWSQCERKVTILNAVIKNKSDFPAFFVEASLNYQTATGDVSSYEILKPTELTYIPSQKTYIIQRVLEIAPKGAKFDFDAHGVTYYENSSLHRGFHELKVTSFEVFEKDGWPNFRIKLKNDTKKVLSRIGFEIIFKPHGKWVYNAVPLTYGEAHAYPVTKNIVDESKPGRPVVEEAVSIQPGETVTIENYLDMNLVGAMGTPDFFRGVSKIVYSRAFGLEVE